MPRLYVPFALRDAQMIDLPPETSRHVQVWRLQPGDALSLFDGSGREWSAVIEKMGRQIVSVKVGVSATVDRELPVRVTVASVMPANDRMDWLIEKATELGAAEMIPLMSRRSVLRLQGERSERKQSHWQGVAVAAAEQCGRAIVPRISLPQSLADWLHQSPIHAGQHAWILSLSEGTQPLSQRCAQLARHDSVTILVGPEGGWDPEEESMAMDLGWQPTRLGARVLRAETAPLAALAAIDHHWMTR